MRVCTQTESVSSIWNASEGKLTPAFFSSVHALQSAAYTLECDRLTSTPSRGTPLRVAYLRTQVKVRV
jgi:hypothetical protein